MIRVLLISVFGIAAGLAIAFALSQRGSTGETPAETKSEKSIRAKGSSRSTEPCIDCDFPAQ